MLKEIAARRREEVAASKLLKPAGELIRELTPGRFAFSEALRRSSWSLIAECKLASPSKGVLCDRYDVPTLAGMFTAGGAKALSVHTSKPFLGRLEDLARVREVSPLPILRKDFIIDEYQLYESRWAGADAVLLIAALLTDRELSRYLAVANQLGLDCLVEVHTREELRQVIALPAELVGINNRDLRSFTTDLGTTFELLPYVGGGRTVISESGITDGRDAERLRQAGVRGILVGEGLVRADDVLARTRELAMSKVACEPENMMILREE